MCVFGGDVPPGYFDWGDVSPVPRFRRPSLIEAELIKPPDIILGMSIVLKFEEVLFFYATAWITSKTVYLCGLIEIFKAILCVAKI